MTFIRQVASLCLNPNQLINDPRYPDDVKKRVIELLNGVRGQSISTYTSELGIRQVRQHIAEYITKRDGGIHCDLNDVVCSNGASAAIKDVLTLFRTEGNALKTGILTPVPQYPLYGSTIKEFGLHQINYHLDETEDWSLNVSELENVVNYAKSECNPRVLVVINPGNPTGQVLSRSCIEEVIKFAYREKLFIMADEVYQQNVYQEERPFHSFKKVMVEMGAPYSTMELASFMSTSKGYSGECGIRGGCVELFNMSPDIRRLFDLILQTHICPSAIGQVVLDCISKEPSPGDTSYKKFITEKEAILLSLKRRSIMASEALNSFKNISCNRVAGAMYAFPRLHLSEKAIDAAEKSKMEPDAFYAVELLKATGICTSPGYMFGQRQGTYHLRMTVLAEENRLRNCLEDFKRFNEEFVGKYA